MFVLFSMAFTQLRQGGHRLAAACAPCAETPARWPATAGRLPDDRVIEPLKALEAENARLRGAVADLTVDQLILKEVAEGKY